MTLDKEQYSPGDIIRISGTGPANSPVDLKMIDPDTKVKTAHSNSSEDGTYSIIYIIPSDAETGNWKSILTVGNEKSETTVKVTV